MKHGEELLQELRAQLASSQQHDREEWERLTNEQPDDCSLIIHQRTAALTQKILQAKIQILENKGMSEFTFWANPDGTKADIKYVKTKFGYAYMIKANGETQFTSSEKKLNQMGYHEQIESLPAWVTASGGNGFSGLLTTSVSIFKSSTNYYTGEPAETK
jgi:hypothetical protein